MVANSTQILLIDDDPDMHLVVGMILEPEGYQVSCCRTGSEGLATMRRHRPDLVLLDIMLSHPSGPRPRPARWSSSRTARAA